MLPKKCLTTPGYIVFFLYNSMKTKQNIVLLHSQVPCQCLNCSLARHTTNLSIKEACNLVKKVPAGSVPYVRSLSTHRFR